MRHSPRNTYPKGLRNWFRRPRFTTFGDLILIAIAVLTAIGSLSIQLVVERHNANEAQLQSAIYMAAYSREVVDKCVVPKKPQVRVMMWLDDEGKVKCTTMFTSDSVIGK